MKDREYLIEQVLEQIKNGYTQPDEETAVNIVNRVIIPYCKDQARATDTVVNPDNY